MKKLLAIALIAPLTIGSALQAKRDHPKQDDARPSLLGTAPAIKSAAITDPKELDKQIKEISADIRKIRKELNRYDADQAKAAKKGDQALIQELNRKISLKDAELFKNQKMLHGYIVRLAALKAKEQKTKAPKGAKKEKIKKKEVKKAKKTKTKRAK